ncbi:Protein GVQW1, partial [Plecturocebus cupreus]
MPARWGCAWCLLPSEEKCCQESGAIQELGKWTLMFAAAQCVDRGRLSGNLLSSWDYRHMLPFLANSVFFVETGFCHVAQLGPELLSSNDLLTLASQSVGITSVSTVPGLWAYFYKRN